MMTPVLQWLGRISYSLYLTHLIVLLTLHYGLRGLMPSWQIPLLLGRADVVGHRWPLHPLRGRAIDPTLAPGGPLGRA
jgi:hypothetical protein